MPFGRSGCYTRNSETTQRCRKIIAVLRLRTKRFVSSGQETVRMHKNITITSLIWICYLKLNVFIKFENYYHKYRL